MKVSEIKVEGQMMSHMALDTAHILKHECTIVAPGTFVDGRKFYREVITKKHKGELGKFGKSKTSFYFTLDGPIYNTIYELLQSIGIEQ
jgi:hypothetical protein